MQGAVLRQASSVCNDGVTAAKEVELENVEENLGARTICEAAQRTGRVVRAVLENAVSAASGLLLTENMLIGLPEEKKEHAPPTKWLKHSVEL